MKLLKLAVFCTAFNMAIGLQWGDPCPSITPPENCDEDKFLECKYPFNIPTIQGNCGCRGPNTAWTEFPGAPGACGLQVGQRCSATGIGCAKFSTCAASGQCTCDAGLMVVNTTARGESVCRAGHGINCPDASVCHTDVGLECRLNGANLQCLCSSTEFWDIDRDKCVSKVEGPCGEDRDDTCVKNAECTSFVCKCLPGYSKSNDGTRCLRDFDTPCTTAAECNADKHLTCGSTSKKCECTARYGRYTEAIPNECRLLAQQTGCELPDDCHSERCESQVGTSVRMCICEPREPHLPWDPNVRAQVQVADGTCRWDNDYCYEDYTCGPKKICDKTGQPAGTTYGRCSCVIGTGIGDVECQMKVDEACKEDQNCVSNAACLEGVCKCEMGYNKNNASYCRASHGTSPCSEGCDLAAGLTCISNSCQCPVGQVWEGDAARCAALVGGSCEITANSCTKNAYCTDAGICECSEGYTHTGMRELHEADDSRKCLKTHAETCDPIADPCNNYEFLTCKQNGIGNDMTCECIYPEQQVWDNSTTKCRSVNGGFCGRVLEEHEWSMRDTAGFNATCVEGAKCVANSQGIFRCQCDDTQVAIGEVCVDTATGSSNSLAVISLFTIVAISNLSKLLW